eukprot:m.56349 g.56349  ORF g.56349 m.56349 type:complete len:74 (+) comp15578_c1_seq4:824-1045(+)
MPITSLMEYLQRIPITVFVQQVRSTRTRRRSKSFLHSTVSHQQFSPACSRLFPAASPPSAQWSSDLEWRGGSR